VLLLLVLLVLWLVVQLVLRVLVVWWHGVPCAPVLGGRRKPLRRGREHRWPATAARRSSMLPLTYPSHTASVVMSSTAAQTVLLLLCLQVAWLAAKRPNSMREQVR
jgi:hypothetical protein